MRPFRGEPLPRTVIYHPRLSPAPRPNQGRGEKTNSTSFLVSQTRVRPQVTALFPDAWQREEWVNLHIALLAFRSRRTKCSLISNPGKLFLCVLVGANSGIDVGWRGWVG